MGVLWSRVITGVGRSRSESSMSIIHIHGTNNNKNNNNYTKSSGNTSPLPDNKGLLEERSITIPEIRIQPIVATGSSCESLVPRKDYTEEVDKFTLRTNAAADAAPDPVAAKDTCVPSSATSVRTNQYVVPSDRTSVDLPQRYKTLLNKKQNFQNQAQPACVVTEEPQAAVVGKVGMCDEGEKAPREHAHGKLDDLSQAVAWVQQELESLRAQDKALLRQFLDLRAAIRSLRAGGGPRLRTLSYGGQDEKLETMRQQSDGAVASDAAHDVTDDDEVFSSCVTSDNMTSLLQEQCSVEFRARTVSCLGPRERYQPVQIRHGANS